MKKPRILWLFPEFLDEIPALRGELVAVGQLDPAELNQAELTQRIGNYEIIVPRLSHEINAGVLERAKQLRLIGTPTTGTDHIDIDAARRRGIEVVSIKDDREFLDSVQATAELAWLHILAASRNFRQAIAQVQEGGWVPVRGHELMGKTLGIVGYGRLGTMVGRFARAFGMDVVATDPRPITDSGIEQLPLANLLVRADIVTLHLHLTDQTRGLIGRREFELMKRGVILVNTSRGGLVDEAALLDALRSGHVAAAGLDVICGERDPDRANRPLMRYLRDHPNLIITPHIGGCTEESQSKAMRFLVTKLRRSWEAKCVDAAADAEAR